MFARKKTDQRIGGFLPDKIKTNLQLLAMTLPGAVWFFVFCYIPLPGIIIAFKKFNANKGIFGSKWVGWKNFEFFFNSVDFERIMRNTILYSLAYLVTVTVAGLLLAILLYNLKSSKGLKVYHSAIVLPRFMSTVIIAYIVYTLLSPTYGIFNNIIKSFGGTPLNWYAEPKYWPWILVITNLWQDMGMKSILYYASLVSLDYELLESADLDGANQVQKARYIMLPHLASVTGITLILGLGGILGGDFGLHYQVTKDQGVLYPTTDIISTYTFRALMGGSMERSAAVGLFQSVVGCIMVIVTNLVVRKISPENSLF